MTLSKSSCSICGSSDGVHLYDDGAYCFSHGAKVSLEDKPEKRYKMTYTKITKEEVLTYPIRGTNNDRLVKEITNKRFEVRWSFNTTTNEPDTVYYPYYYENALSGYKVRGLPKDFDQANIGNIKTADMFGKKLCNTANKTLIITEGEEDALTIAQILYEYSGCKKWPNVVSIKNGSQGAEKEVKRNLAWIENHDRVILSFDNDEPGLDAVNKLTSILDPNKLYLMLFSEKDANSCLKTGKQNEIIEQFLNPKMYRPAAVVDIVDLKDRFLKPNSHESVPFPYDWKILNKLTYGMKLGSLEVFTSGTGNGKTQLFKEIGAHLITNTHFNIGIISLEESLEECMEGLAGILLNKRVTIPEIRDTITAEDASKAWGMISSGNRVTFHDHNDLNNMQAMFSIRYMAAIKDCKFIFLDHLTLLVSDTGMTYENGDSLDKTDRIMANLRTICQKYNVWIGIIVHLRKGSVDGSSFELGAIPTEDDLKGSGSLKQIANSVFALQRNRRHPQPTMRDITQIHILKHRRTGRSGEADFLKFDQQTGRMLATHKPNFDIIVPKRRKSYGNDDE